jgi:hypothetical protein
VEVQQDGSDETISNLTQALEKEKEKNEKESDPDSLSLSSTTPLKTRRRGWFRNKDKDRASISSTEQGRATGSNVGTVDGAGNGKGTASRPVSIQGSSKPSQYSAREGSVGTSDNSSLRDKDSSMQDHLDTWSTRASGGTERAEREFGLSDEVNMGLS